MPPKLRTRKPTGIVPWPLILIEGEEGSGKSYSAAEFSASDLIGQTYWIDLAEGSADEYAAIDGARYEIIDHTGTFRDILEQIEAVHAEARRAALAEEPPVVLVIDSASALWRMLTTWTQERARRTKKNRLVLEEDPDAAVDITMNLWNDAVDRWQRVIHLLQTFSGIVVCLARGKQVSVVDDNGNPVGKLKEWRVQGHKDLPFDSSVWVRLKRDEDPQVIKARSLRLRVEKRRPMRLPDFTIEHLVFGLMGCSVSSQPRQMPALAGDRVSTWLDDNEVEDSEDIAELSALWRKAAAPEEGLERREVLSIRAEIEAKVERLKNPPTEMGERRTATDGDKLREAAARDAEAGDAPNQPDPQEPEQAAASRRRPRASRTTTATRR
ncbi:AAA family ATPase [Streptomyces sp. NPDC056465]|uniref:AAA family ATPase n=1 Tax=Streptomyces sp. NPDC056465 TaxID=3345829 RepID=UPI00369A5C40